MARTPLLRRFQALFADSEEAERSGRSLEAIEEERLRNRLTRRDFLKVAGATAGAAAMAGALPALGRASSGPRIGIIGAGIAGLNAALTLQDKGMASKVFEASDRIGGR